MDLVYRDDRVFRLSEHLGAPQRFQVGESIVWYEGYSRLEGEVVTVETDAKTGRRIITVAIERSVSANEASG